MSDPPENDEAAAPKAEPETAEPKTEAAPEAGAPKRKRRKKAAPPGATSGAERPALDASGRSRPAFLLRFPEDPELEEVIRAFEAGNYARVTELGTRLAETTKDVELRAAAEELVRRTEPDPLVRLMLGLVAALLLAVVAYAYFAA
jgi:hypothetical protein